MARRDKKIFVNPRMDKKLLKVFIIPLVITAIFFAGQAFLLFNQFGVFSIVEEIPVDFKKISRQDIHLLKDQKVSGTFKASEDNLGILFIQLVKFGQGSDRVVFRIRGEEEEKWYYESKFSSDQIQNNDQFPLGFPPIINSKNNLYIFEIESLDGNYKNGVEVVKDKPAAAMYKYSLGEMTNYKVLFSFTYKKLLYTLKNINYWQVVAVFAVSSLLTIFTKKTKVTVTKTARFLLIVKNEPRRALRMIVDGIISSYLYLEAKFIYFIKKLVRWFSSTKFYSLLLNTNTKKRIAIGLLMFLLVLTYRFTASLVNQDKFFYAELGGGGDYDQFIRAATCALNFCSWIIHQNLLIESSILGVFYKIFGFTGGLKAYLYLMLILSSIVATLPYILLSRKNFFTIGGIIGSLFLVTSDFLTEVALSFPPDNGSTFIFSMFFIVYLLTMHFGTIRWLIAFGLMGFFDGMFKALFLINDLVVLALFAPLFFYERVKKVGISFNKQVKLIFQSKNIKLLLLSFIPLFIFIILYSAWEYFVQIKFTAPYFLKLLIDTRGSDFRFETLVYDRSSGEAEQGLILQLFYLLISGVVMVKRVVSLSDLQVIFLAPIFFGLLFFSFIKSKFKTKLSPVKLGTILVLSVVNIALLVSIKNNYLGIHELFPGEYIYANWILETYVSVFLFASIIFLFILNFKYQAFKLALPIIPYVIMLIILTKNAPWVRLLAHVIVWSIILFSFLIDRILTNAKKNNALKKLWIGSIILVLFIFSYTIPKTSSMVGLLYSGINNNRNEVKYLRWVNSELPENAIILGGGKSDLVTLGENISKPIVYNTSWNGAVLIRPKEIPGVGPEDFTLINELQNKDNFKKNKYIILERDIDLWQSRISGVGDGVFTTSTENINALHAEDYSIKVFKSNPVLSKSIYELILKEETSLTSLQINPTY